MILFLQSIYSLFALKTVQGVPQLYVQNAHSVDYFRLTLDSEILIADILKSGLLELLKSLCELHAQ